MMDKNMMIVRMDTWW